MYSLLQQGDNISGSDKDIDSGLQQLIFISTVVPNRLINEVFTNAKPAKETDETKVWMGLAEKLADDLREVVFGSLPMVKKDAFIEAVAKEFDTKFILSSQGIRD